MILAQPAGLFQALTPEHFVDPSNREAFEVLAAALRQAEGLGKAMTQAPATAGSAAAVSRLREHARRDSEAGRLFVRMVLEADEGRYPPAMLEELHLRLQQQVLERRIASLRRRLDDTKDQRAVQEHLFRLQQALQQVRVDLLELEPEEG